MSKNNLTHQCETKYEATNNFLQHMKNTEKHNVDRMIYEEQNRERKILCQLAVIPDSIFRVVART